MPSSELPATPPSHGSPFWSLLGFLAPYKVTLVVSLLLAVVAQGGSLAFPWLTKDVVGAIKAHHRGQLPTLIGIVLAVGLVKALCTVGRRLISGKQALGVELDLRN